MSEWKKQPVTAPEEAESAVTADTPATEAESAVVAEEASDGIYRRPGHRRGKRRMAAALGFVTVLFALFGVVSLVIFAVLGINIHRENQLDEIAYFVSPLTAFEPEPFESLEKTDQDALLLSAIYCVTTDEQIRQMQENTAECSYELDDMGRMKVPVTEVEAAYAALYGKDAVPYHHTIGEEGLSYTYSYDKEAGIYYIPQDAGNSMYYLVYDRLVEWFGTVTVDVGYVSGTLEIDDRGQTVEPAMEDARIVQRIKLKKTDDGYRIVSVKDIKRG